MNLIRSEEMASEFGLEDRSGAGGKNEAVKGNNTKPPAEHG